MSTFYVIVVTLGVLCGIYCHSFEDHKTWRFEKNILNPDNAIVQYASTSRSVVDCCTKCGKDPIVISLYYESTTKLCYCNHDLDVNPNISLAGKLVYGYPSLSYVAETSDDGERIVTSTSPDDECLKLINTAHDIDLFNNFIHHSPHISLYTYCHQVLARDWTVFQRRLDGSVDFFRPWTDYVNGFGNSLGEFWLGLEKIHQITKNNKCDLNITMEAEPNNPVLKFGYAHYDSFNLAGADDNYRLYVAGFSGTVGDSFSYHSGFQFSTFEADHDVYNTKNCADLFKGGWWYRACHKSNLNGLYLNGHHASYADGIDWRYPWGIYYSLIKVEMKVRCLSDNV